MVNDVEVLYIIYETESGITRYRAIQHSSGLVRDIQYNLVVQYNLDLSRAKQIEIRDIQKYSGRLLQGVNDFETYCRLNNLLYLIEQYDTSKNNKAINQITKGCIDKVWWKCNECGHSWQAHIKSRTGIHRSQCPMCRFEEGKYHTLVQGKNDLYTWCINNNRKDILEEYSPNNIIKASEVAALSVERVEWICTICGNIYNAPISSKTRMNCRCSNCTRNGTSFPEMFIFEFLNQNGVDVRYRYKVNKTEIDIFITSLKTAIDYRGAYWHIGREDKDKEKLEYLKRLGIQTFIIDGYARSDNRVVSDNHIIFGESDYIWLADILENRFDLKLDTSRDYVNKILQDVTAKKNSKQVLNSLAETHPKVAEKWDYERNGNFKPTNITYGTKYKAWFICNRCGESYYSPIRKQALGHGCPYCNISKKLT